MVEKRRVRTDRSVLTYQVSPAGGRGACLPPPALGRAPLPIYRESSGGSTASGSPRGLVHRRRDALKHSTMGPNDRLGGFRPGERRRVLLPGAQVGVEMVAQGLLRVEVRHAQGLFAENAEEPFHLIEPRRAGR